MTKRKPATGTHESSVTHKKPKGGSLSFTVDEALAICQTASETAIEPRVLRHVFGFLTRSIKTRETPTESDAALLGALASILKSSSASIKGLQDTEPYSLASVDAAAIGLLGTLGDLLKEEAGRPLVESLLAIAQRHIPCQPTSKQYTVYADAFAALATAAKFLDEALMTTQDVLFAIVAALDQCFDAVAQDSVVELLYVLGVKHGGTWIDVLVQSGAITSLCRLICSMEAADVPPNGSTALGNCLVDASPQQVLQIYRLVGRKVIAFQLAPALARRASLCKQNGWDLWALQGLVDRELLSKQACVQAGAIPAALANLRHGTYAGDAAELLECVVDGPEAAASLLASHGIWHIASALAAADTRQMLHFLSLLSFLVGDESSSCPATLQCLRQGVLWRVQRRYKQLEKEEAKQGNEDNHRAASDKASEQLSRFTNLLQAGITVELERLALAPIVKRHALWVGCFLAAHTADDRLRVAMLDWGVLQRLCKRLGAATPPPQESQAATARHADDLELHRAVAGGLLALLKRLGVHGQAASAPAATPTGHATLHLPIDEGALEGQRRWRDVKLLVEGREFHVLQDALLHACPAFRAMLEGGFSEQEAPEIAIPNVTVAVWKVVMRFVYTGEAMIPPDLAQQVLIFADQYDLSGLKSLCQEVLIAHLTPANLPDMFALAGGVSAHLLQRACIAAALEHWEAGETFSQAHPGGPAGSCLPALQPEQQAAPMHIVPDTAEAGQSEGAKATDPHADVQMEAGQQRAAAQQLLGLPPSAGASLCDPLQGTEQRLASPSGTAAVTPQASAGHPSGGPDSGALADVMAKEASYMDQQLRRQVAAVLLPLLKQLMEEVLPRGAGPAS